MGGGGGGVLHRRVLHRRGSSMYTQVSYTIGVGPTTLGWGGGSYNIGVVGLTQG
jgi:hypothetical protein